MHFDRHGLALRRIEQFAKPVLASPDDTLRMG